MSRTDKTRPQWVQMADTPMATSVPVHDHRFGGCTLPAEITPESTKPTGCHWVATAFYGDSRGGNRERHYLLRTDRRRSRHEARRALRDSHLG
ncbi:hypothetical protein [Actinoplanes sp. TFC3]|uniref:hypothetical protein n=1 Tax=Actinoplanes sp. TFC3 TaxID=1710355 RepID=UPI000835A318|nr:hypothetical protein [Actinoplanes sp. TFC3]